ncbi:unnamed protein product [Tuber aestivum]|uniref:Sox C-terminal domain-containing protein n=1 Tax=Tuber aestivum TaxID=59557 RepID=A0A292Q399_9PEZI|nr:unnamed protein product [Tuber aestivum]
MATTATAPSAVTNGASPNASSNAAGGRPQLKSSITGGSGGGGNSNRRPTQSPIDGAQRRNSAHKPWQASNQQQKYNGTGNPASASPTPSQSAAMKSRGANASSGGESDTHDKHMHDRTLYLLMNLVPCGIANRALVTQGKQVTITLRNGARFAGILTGADTKSHDLGATMKWVRQVRTPLGDSDERVEEGEYVGGGLEKAMVFEPKDLVDIFAERIALGEDETQLQSAHQNGAPAGNFRTDADISGNLALRERELRRWQPDEKTTELSLEESGQGSGQSWNQFEVNERLFGVKSDFNPDLYTTKVDRSHPLYQQREAIADKIAREIESQGVGPNMNPHLAEERGVSWGDDSGKDEEDKYGAVQRTPAPSILPQIQPSNNRYKPPALRAPTALPTVPGAPHDPAIISSQLLRPETLQQNQQQSPQAPRPPLPQITLNQQPPSKGSEDVSAKPKEKTSLPETIAPKRGHPAPSSADPPANSSDPPLPQEVNETFKRFVNSEKERYKKKKADLVQKDRASKLEELRKFSQSFVLKTEVPQDLVPILAKDKSKQAEIIEKAKKSVAKITSAPPTAAVQPPQTTRVPPPNSFAAKNPEEFQLTRQQLLQGFPPTQSRPSRSQQAQQAPLSTRLYQIAADRRVGHQVSVRSPVPIPEHPHSVPTGPAAAANIPTAPKSTSPSSAAHLRNLSAKAPEFKPNPNAISFTPTLGGPSTNATPSPTTSAHAHSSRAASPSAFFGNKKVKPSQEKPLIADRFNPFKRMKAAPATPAPTDGPIKKIRGNSNDYIERAFVTTPTWPTTEQNADKKWEQMFAKPEFSIAASIHSPQPPHVMPQPHHQQIPSHIPHINPPPHIAHQSHPHMPQHMGIPPPQYEPEQHLRQIPPSVMASPSLHNATVAPYQQSPVAHPSQIGPVFPSHQQAQYAIPSGPGGPAYGYYGGGGFRGTAGAGPMMVQGPQPMPYPAGQFFPHPYPFSPQQPPPPPSSQGYPSPGRGAPMMMHQGSQQGTPAGPQMMQYTLQPAQGAPMYAGQGQQQSELLLHGPSWLPPRPQSTVSLPPVPSTPVAKFAFSRAASPVAPSPRMRNLHLSPQPASATPLLASPLATYTTPSASGSGLSSYALQRSQTGNAPMGAGVGRGRRQDHSGGSSAAYMAPIMMMPSGPVYNAYSNDGSVGMIRGQPHSHHQGAPPPSFFHGPHFPPGGRGNGYGHPQQHQGGQHAPPPPPPQSQSQQAPPEGEDTK